MCAQWRHRSAWASTQSDQSSLPARRNLGSVAPHWAHSEDSDQNGRIPRLICVFAVRMSHFVCYLCHAPAHLLCSPVAQNQNRHFLCSLFPKIVCAPVPLIFQTLVPVFLWNKCLCSRVPFKTPEKAHQLGKAYSAKCKELVVRCVIWLLNGTGG